MPITQKPLDNDTVNFRGVGIGHILKTIHVVQDETQRGLCYIPGINDGNVGDEMGWQSFHKEDILMRTLPVWLYEVEFLHPWGIKAESASSIGFRGYLIRRCSKYGSKESPRRRHNGGSLRNGLPGSRAGL